MAVATCTALHQEKPKRRSDSNFTDRDAILELAAWLNQKAPVMTLKPSNRTITRAQCFFKAET
jgi:hypothetical protein